MAAGGGAAAAAGGGDGGALAAVPDAQLQEHMHMYRQMLEEDSDHNKFRARIVEMVAAERTRLVLDLNEIREYDQRTGNHLAEGLMQRPLHHLPALERIVTEAANVEANGDYIQQLASGAGKKDQMVRAALDRHARVMVGFKGSFGGNTVSPRGLTAELMGQLTCVQGIVTKCTAVRPKVARSVHFCPSTSKFHTREYRDATDPYGIPTSSVYPTKDEDGNLLETEFGLSAYRDHQIFTIQEMPERAPLGQLPRSVDIIADNDLVDVVKPGDRVAISGVFRALAGRVNGQSRGNFRTVMLANNVELLRKQVSSTVMTAEDVKNIRTFAKRPDCFELLARSMAPAIYGHKYIKEALVLLLLGGVKHELKNGTRLRGDINMLMVGDPSCGKSQLLRFVLGIAPLAVNTTGRGSSGVGLTAAVSTDKETGDRRLEAGAMVLADGGVVCIDEFDKMSDMDRVAIHEVMEQQTVTIAKAGIQAQLNARCSVVAAANPIYGQYDDEIGLQRNVNLPDSLLSRFDLLFIVRDLLDQKRDRQIAAHVLNMHRYQRPGQEGKPVPLDATAEDASNENKDDDGDDTSPIFQRFNPLLHAGATEDAHLAQDGEEEEEEEGGAAAGGGRQKVQILSLDFVKKFISFCKARTAPVLTKAAEEVIAAAYSEDLRAGQQERSMPITARSLETLIRLSSAHAKSRLSKTVDKEDARKAVEILEEAAYARTAVDGQPRKVTGRKRSQRRGDGGDDGEDDDQGGDGGIAADGGFDSLAAAGAAPKASQRAAAARVSGNRSGAPKRRRKTIEERLAGDDDDDDDEEDDDLEATGGTVEPVEVEYKPMSKAERVAAAAKFSDSPLIALMRTVVAAFFRQTGSEQSSVPALRDWIDATRNARKANGDRIDMQPLRDLLTNELEGLLHVLDGDNSIMLNEDGEIFSLA